MTATCPSWFGAFFAEYLTVGQIARLMAASAVYVLLLGVPMDRVLLLWALPAILSAFQLFYFGTYLPHRAEEAEAFGDRHRARSNDFSWTLSLLTCFHFGYHHEHHDNPSVPWWRLPSRRLPPTRGAGR